MTTPKLPPPPRSAQNRSGCSLGAGGEHLAVGGDDLGGEQVVDRHAVAAHQPALTAAERQAGDAGGGDHAAGRGQPVEPGGPVVVAPGTPALRPRPCALAVDPDALHRREVDHQAAVGDGASRPRCGRRRGRRSRGSCSRAELDGVDDVGGGVAAGDERRALVDQPVVDPAGLLVARLARSEQRAREPPSQVGGNLDHPHIRPLL